MLEKYESAIEKIRRIDDLKDELRALKGEDDKLSSSATVYRKKNDHRERAGNDGAITRINDRRATVSKREALVKAEIKSLRNEVYDILSECFAEAKSEEHRAKVREACIYASDGRYVISEVGKTPAGFTKCRIIGKRFTRSEENDGKVERIVRGGIKNTSGRFLILPEIVVYVYDKDRVEGEYVAVNEYYSRGGKSAKETTETDTDEIEKRIARENKESKGGEALESVKERFVNRSSLIALCFALVWAGFSFWAAMKGAAGIIGNDIIRFSVAYAAISLAVAFSSAMNGRENSDGDLFSLLSLYGGALSAFSLAVSKDPIAALPLPASMFVGGLITAVLPERRKNGEENARMKLVVRIALGVWLGLLIRAVGQSDQDFAMFFNCALAAVGLFGCVCVLVLLKNKDPRNVNSLKAYLAATAVCVGVIALALKPVACVIMSVSALTFAIFALMYGDGDNV